MERRDRSRLARPRSGRRMPSTAAAEEDDRPGRRSKPGHGRPDEEAATAPRAAPTAVDRLRADRAGRARGRRLPPHPDRPLRRTGASPTTTALDAADLGRPRTTTDLLRRSRRFQTAPAEHRGLRRPGGMGIGPTARLALGPPAQPGRARAGLLPDGLLPAGDDLPRRRRHDLEDAATTRTASSTNVFCGCSACRATTGSRDPSTALLPAIVVASIWQGFGFETVVFLAALGGRSPATYYDAAPVDGAGPVGAVPRTSRCPGCARRSLFVYIIGIIGSFQVFDQVFVMTQGGPINSTRTIVFDLVDRFNSLKRARRRPSPTSSSSSSRRSRTCRCACSRSGHDHQAGDA